MSKSMYLITLYYHSGFGRNEVQERRIAHTEDDAKQWLKSILPTLKHPFYDLVHTIDEDYLQGDIYHSNDLDRPEYTYYIEELDVI